MSSSTKSAGRCHSPKNADKGSARVSGSGNRYWCRVGHGRVGSMDDPHQKARQQNAARMSKVILACEYGQVIYVQGTGTGAELVMAGSGAWTTLARRCGNKMPRECPRPYWHANMAKSSRITLLDLVLVAVRPGACRGVRGARMAAGESPGAGRAGSRPDADRRHVRMESQSSGGLPGSCG